MEYSCVMGLWPLRQALFPSVLEHGEWAMMFIADEDIAGMIARAVIAERERCASIAEHLNGWGSARGGRERAAELAAHIAKVIRTAPKY
jgi:hypothetical protein